MKLIFLSELRTFGAGEKGFNFFYNTFKKGPCSQEVLAILEDLTNAGLITNDYKENTIKITKAGQDVITEFLNDQKSNEKENNDFIFQKIDEVIQKYGNLTTKALLEKVYSLDIKTPSGKQINIGKAVEEFEKTEGKKKPCLLLKRSKYNRKLKIPPEWAETFSVLCNPRFKNLADSCYV